MNKKRYAGLYWTRPEKYDKLDAKGIEIVRRDNCLLVRRIVGTCLNKILIDRDVAGAVDYCKVRPPRPPFPPRTRARGADAAAGSP